MTILFTEALHFICKSTLSASKHIGNFSIGDSCWMIFTDLYNFLCIWIDFLKPSKKKQEQITVSCYLFSEGIRIRNIISESAVARSVI